MLAAAVGGATGASSGATLSLRFTVPRTPRQADLDVELSRVRDELKRCDSAVAASERKIISVYREFENLVENLSSDPLAPKIAEAARRAISSVRDDESIRKMAADPTQRQNFTVELRKRFSQEIGAALPESIRGAVSGRLSLNLYSAVSGESDAGPAIQKAVADICTKWFDSAAPAHELWNRDLFKEVAAAREYADARAALASANEKLSRLEHPERFHPAFAGTPEGMVFVLGGAYTLGPDDGYDIDTTKRKVTFQVSIKPFYLDKTEVTNKQYADFLKAVGRTEAKARLPQGWQWGKDGTAAMPVAREAYPVTGIGYEDATAYALWAKKRLPTEDEWETAARGARSYLYPWGARYESKRANDLNGELGGTGPVGTFPGDVSPFGALDMAGNVMEWTATIEGGKPAPAKLEGPTNIVIRGGAYDRDPKRCSATYRWVYASTTKVANLGFRCARDAF